MKAGQYAFNSRKTKKRINRGLMQVRINAAVRPLRLSYSKLMGALKKKNVELDRKVLSQIAAKHPAIFAKIAEMAK